MSINILLVEDSPSDAYILSSALEGFNDFGKIQVAQDGTEAIEILDSVAQCPPLEHPHLILLDLNLPGRSGHEVLNEIKSSSSWKKIPIIVFSSSSAPRDITRSYELQANAFISKPRTLEGYELVAKRIHDFWLSTAQLPLI